MKTYTIDRLSFQAPATGVEVKSIGDGACEAALMNPAAPAERGAWLNLVVVPSDMLESIPEATRMPYFKGAFMGAGGPLEKVVTREIMGKPVAGEAQKGRIPKPVAIEAYLAPLPGGEALFLGTRTVVGFATDAAEAFFAQVASTLAVAPPG